MTNSLDFYEKLVEEYKMCAKVHYSINYGDKESVIHGNKAVSQMIRIAKEINSKFPQKVVEFSKLLQVRESAVDIWVAHHILEHMSYTKEIEKQALKVIKRYARKCSVVGLGDRIWLKEWYAKNRK